MKIEKEFKVWYSSKKKWYDLSLTAMEDSGIIILDDTGLLFKGKKEEIRITNIQDISFGKFGRDFVNNWIKIEYKVEDDSTKTAFFADKKYLGWSGVFGGTKRLFNNIKEHTSN